MKRSDDVVRLAYLLGGVLVLSFASKIFGKPAPTIRAVNLTNLSFNQNVYRTIADTLYVALWGDSVLALPWELDDLTSTELMKMKTLDDVLFLILSYGERAPFFESNMPLPATIAKYLDAENLAAVNANYVNKNINFQW